MAAQYNFGPVPSQQEQPHSPPLFNLPLPNPEQTVEVENQDATGKMSHQAHSPGFPFKHPPQSLTTTTTNSCLLLIQLGCYPSQLFHFPAQMQMQQTSCYWTWSFCLQVMGVLKLSLLFTALMITDCPIWNARHQPINTSRN